MAVAPAPGEPLVFREETVSGPVDGRIGVHAPALVAFEDGELLAAWFSYTGPGELAGSAIYMARRSVEQDAWSPAQMHIDRPEGDGNPVLYAESDHVWLFQAVVLGGWSTSRVQFQESDDRGNQWTKPRPISGPIGTNTRFAPLRTASGDLLLPAYDDLLHRSLFFSASGDDRWGLTSVIDCPEGHECIQPSVTQLPGGRLLAVMRNVGQGWLWVTASDDGGRHWAQPRDSHFANPGSGAQILVLSNRHLILILNDSPDNREKLSVALSTDEGMTWTRPRILASSEATCDYPAAVQTSDSLIHVLYSRDRTSIQHIIVSESWITGE